jgi:riboflavin synthase
MFSGLISDMGQVVAVVPRGALRRLRIACAYRPESIRIGASIACAGPCLTVVATAEAQGGTVFDADVGAETMARTTAGRWQVGTRLNLERSLTLGDELGGHLVTGHVDDVAIISARKDFDGMAQFEVTVPPRLLRFIAEKGAVCLDGTSLTVNTVSGDRLSVLIIPHTLAVTTWGTAKVGDAVNLEVDLMARYVARLMQGAETAQ